MQSDSSFADSNSIRVKMKIILCSLMGLVLCDETCVEDAQGNGISSHPASDDILGDFDHDGIVEKKEIDIMRKKLHDLFDKNANGEMDPDEIRSLVDKENDMSAIYQKLDTNMDEKISMDELDNRWEHLGHELSPEEVADWVSFSVQLPQYAPNFRRHYISGYSFPLLIEDDGRRLVDIGIENPLHQQQLKLFIRRRIAGIGKAPAPVDDLTCQVKKGSEVLLKWDSFLDDDSPVDRRYQLEIRRMDELHWHTIYSGSDDEYLDHLESAHEVVRYRLSSRNSYGRSKRLLISCNHHEGRRDDSPPSPSIWRLVSWLDDLALVLLLIFMPYRLLVNGQADWILRFLHRLPPNRPRRVTVVKKLASDEPSVIVCWTTPADNGVNIRHYCVSSTNVRSGMTSEVLVNHAAFEDPSRGQHPQQQQHEVEISHLTHGETYKFVVTATNVFALSMPSSQSLYMLPMITPRNRNRRTTTTSSPRRRRDSNPEDFELRRNNGMSHHENQGRAYHNRCYICHDPEIEGRVLSLMSTLERRILHFCRSCNRQFCHAHKGKTKHGKTLSCPAIGSKCVCELCWKEELGSATRLSNLNN